MNCIKCGKFSAQYKVCYSCYLISKNNNFNTKLNKLELRDLITNMFCEFFEIDEITLKSKLKKKEIADKRMIYIHFLYKYSNMSMLEIGKFLSRDHTTISYSIDSFNKISQNEKINIFENNLLNALTKLNENKIDIKKVSNQNIQPVYVCEDGHKVKSKTEREIDNYFYRERIFHSYEKEYKAINSQIFYPDFYLPDYNLYIEYFGKNDNEYMNNAYNKIKIYNQDKNINFEYLTFDDEQNLFEKLNTILQKYKG